MEENEDIKEAKEELDRISQDDLLRRKVLNRTLEIADQLQLKKEAKEAREKGLSDGMVTGEKIGIEKEKKAVIKKLYELNISIEQIAKVVELKEEEVKEILNDKKAWPFAIAKGRHNLSVKSKATTPMWRIDMDHLLFHYIKRTEYTK